LQTLELAFIRGQLLLVDADSALLLPGIHPHLLQLRLQLRDLRVELVNTLLQLGVLRLVGLKCLEHSLMLSGQVLVSALQESKVLAHLLR
jgi:hypothetical protein